MGVPGFVMWLKNNYRNKFILKTIPLSNHKNLYIDGNCLIHPVCSNTLANNSQEPDLENIMFMSISSYIMQIINHVNPNFCYFAIDGTGPVAKINQQRYRRYKSCSSISSTSWNNTHITPGTEFMKRLHIYLTDFFKKHKYIHYSSYLEQGEGEHKIFQYIKANKSTHEQTNIIYGLDADLFFLALACTQSKNTYLLREESQIENNDHDVLKYICINTVKHCYMHNLSKYINHDNKPEFIQDFIFVCYLLGNDFIPNLPSLDIANKGLDIVLNAYIQTYKILNYNIVNNNKIDIMFVQNMLQYLSSTEEYVYMNMKQLKDKQEIEQYETYKSNDMFCSSFEDVKYNYYSSHYHINGNQQIYINTMCKTYLDGLIWIYEYYFNTCPSWRWMYPRMHAPFISDICKYLYTNVYEYPIFTPDVPIDMHTQLLCVMPKTCSMLIDEKYRKLMTDRNSPLSDIYPDIMKIDIHNKSKSWKCNLVIPMIDIDRIEKVIKEMK